MVVMTDGSLTERKKIMSRTGDRLMAAAELLSEHETVIDTALTAYAERYRKDAASLQAEYERVSADPELAAQQDDSLITTKGLRLVAETFRQAADRAEAARAALSALGDMLDDQF